MYDRRWIYKEVLENEEVRKYVSGKYGLPEKLFRLCADRGIDTREKADFFFEPGLYKLSDPFMMKGMEDAAERIAEAAENGEVITIYGDYDTDGITAVTILLKFLTAETENKVYYKIPDRINDSYGLSESTIREVTEYGTDLLITVDCGIKNPKEVELAKSLGMDVIVTDHHTPEGDLPECCAVLDPCFEPADSPYCNLCGAGVAFKLCMALGDIFGSDEETLMSLLPYAALGTLADAVSLTGDNRIIAVNGFEALKRSEDPGLLALKNGEQGQKDGALTYRDVNFSIIPVINASGRMGDAGRSVELFTSRDNTYARKIAGELFEDNKRRKDIESKMFERIDDPECNVTGKDDPVTILMDPGWHPGLIALMAGKTVEKHDRSAFIFTKEPKDESLLRGSARSYEGFDMRDALKYIKDAGLDFKFGGHEKAAGITIKKNDLAEFKRLICEYAANVSQQKKDVKITKIDLILKPEEVTLDTFLAINKMEPFGVGNPKPVICTPDLEVIDRRPMGEGKHIRISFIHKDTAGRNYIISGKKFNAEGISLPDLGEKCSILYNPDINSWRGNMTCEALFTDIYEGSFDIENEAEKIYNEDGITMKGFIPNREILTGIYAALRAMGGRVGTEDINTLRRYLTKNGRNIPKYMIYKGLEIFTQLGFINKDGETYTAVADPKKRDLEESEIYNNLTK